METIYLVAAFWFFAAVLSTAFANRLKISIALMEIIVGTIIGYAAFQLGYFDKLSLNADWMKFCTGLGAMLLTFLAGAELNPDVMKSKIKEVSVIGLIGFFTPFIGCFLISFYLIGWSMEASLLCGIALSTTSMAVVYAVMLEYGFNKTDFGKGVLGACFVNDLGTVIALGLIFSIRHAYRLWRAFLECQLRLRALLSRLLAPPASDLADPALQVIQHLQAAFAGAPCPVTAFQLHFNEGFLG